MDFERRQIRKPHSKKIILEFDVVGDVDLITCHQIANKLTASIAKSDFDITCTKASVQSTPQRTHDQVQLPCANSNEQAKYISENRKCTKTT